MWCLTGAEGVLVGDVGKKPGAEKSPKRVQLILEAEGLGAVNPKQE